ncbi:hypothetical protein LWI29_000583 [Acer saccharum]|uniref:RNA-directed DNA polymerase, eukaryota, reverse transcriptase zinc-binding domain protein n=1 Tax=Acer saccharum TaxID=4024 RepID=A0AA39VPX8_ACESA|nr:hypothetical protein LWI29_000583 [Acer saccharum]
MDKVLGGGVLTKGMVVDVVGSLGGLLTLCSIIVSILVSLDKEVVICNLYASNADEKKVVLWEFIVANMNKFSISWIIGDDFNVVLDSSKKIGGPPILSHIRHFQNIVDVAKLVNLPMLGSPFTWSNA